MSGNLYRDANGVPLRSTVYPVGKLTGYRLHFHKQYLDLFPSLSKLFARVQAAAKKKLGDDVLDGYNCLRWDTDFGNLAFQWSPNFDRATEPTLEKTLMAKATGGVGWVVPRKTLILQHKWLWVQDDYTGFDVEKAKERSALWSPHVTSEERRKIMFLEFWKTIRHRWEKK